MYDWCPHGFWSSPHSISGRNQYLAHTARGDLSQCNPLAVRDRPIPLVISGACTDTQNTVTYAPATNADSRSQRSRSQSKFGPRPDPAPICKTGSTIPRRLTPTSGPQVPRHPEASRHMDADQIQSCDKRRIPTFSLVMYDL